MKKHGQHFKLGIVDDAGAFHVIAYAQKDTLDCKTDIEEISSPKTGSAKTRTAGLTSWEFAHEGFWGSADRVFSYGGEYYTSDQLLYLLWKQRKQVRLRYVEDDGWLLAEGTALIERISAGTPVDSMVKMSVKLSGSGELEIVNAANQSGHFVAALKNALLTLYAAEAPLSNVTIAYDGTDLGVWRTGNAVAQFSFPGTFDVSLLSAHNADEPLENITFEDVSRLHLVLLVSSENGTPTVRPYWWNAWSLSDIVIHFAGGASQTLSTRFLQNMGEKVALTASPANITSVTLDGYQVLDCCDITDSMTRTLTLMQTTANSLYVGDVVLSEPLACDMTVSILDSAGNIQASSLLAAGETTVTLSYSERVASAGQIAFRFTDRETGVSAPYSFATAMEEDLATHTILYAYSATNHKMTICCPTQSWPVHIIAGGSVVFNGIAQTPQTFDCNSVTGLSTDRGSYTFQNISNTDCWLIGSDFYLTNTNLSPLYPTRNSVRTGQVIPVMQEPNTGITMVYAADGIEIDSSAVQTLTFKGAISGKNFHVSCFQKDNGNGTYDVTVRLLNALGSLTSLPTNVYVHFGDTLPLQIEIPANSTSATKTMSTSQLWVTPEAHVSSLFAQSAVLNVECAETADITPSHYYYYPVCTLGNRSYADIGYHSSTHGTIRFSNSIFPFAQALDEHAEIPARFSVANHMAYYGGSSVVPSLGVLSGKSTWGVTPILAPDPTLVLMYYDGGESNIAVINQHDHISSRYSAIGDILPFLRVRRNRSSYAQLPVYNAIGLYSPNGQNIGGLRPGDNATTPDGSMKVYTGNMTVPSYETDSVVEFSDTPDGNAISATCLSQYIYIISTSDEVFPKVDS